MSCWATPHKGAYPISANFICLCFSVLSLFVSYLSCSFCNSSVYQKVCFIRSCQRGRDGKGKGNPPSLFCVFGSFCHITKRTSFSLSLGKGTSVLPAFRQLQRGAFFPIDWENAPKKEIHALFFWNCATCTYGKKITKFMWKYHKKIRRKFTFTTFLQFHHISQKC